MPLNHTPVGLNESIKIHATKAADWRHNEKARQAYALFDRLNQVGFEENLPQPVIGWDDQGRLKKAGDYHFEGDGLSLRHHIDLRKDLSELELVIGLIHNAVHLESEAYWASSGWYHSTNFRKRLAEFGLHARKNGDLNKIDVAVFSELLTGLGLNHLIQQLETFEPVEAQVQEEHPLKGAAGVDLSEFTEEGLAQEQEMEGPSVQLPPQHPTETYMGNIVKPPTPDKTPVWDLGQDNPFMPNEGGQPAPSHGPMPGPQAFAKAMQVKAPKPPKAAGKSKQKKWTAKVGGKDVNIRAAVELDAYHAYPNDHGLLSLNVAIQRVQDLVTAGIVALVVPSKAGDGYLVQGAIPFVKQESD